MKRKLKFFMIILIGLILIIAALVVAKKLLATARDTNTTYVVKEETYSNTIEISGVVSAAQQQTLQALSDGTVVAVYVKQGDSVKKGDVIIQLDDTTQVYNLAKHDYDMAQVRITGSQREIELMETQRLALVQKIEERKVTATFDGIIAEIDVSVGDCLEAKDSVGTLVDVSYLVAEVEVAETDVVKLSQGQEVEFKFSAYEETVKGYVVDWPAIGEVTSRGATVVKAKLRIDEYPECILPNFSFSGEIKISPDETFVLVSKYAVGRENKKAYVVLAKTGEKLEVTVSPYDTNYFKVEEGLTGGEVVQGLSTPKSSGSRPEMGGPGQGGPGGNFGGGAGAPPGGM